MSIFYCQDIENTVLNLLQIEDLKKLYGMNQYYKLVVRKRLCDIYDFYSKINEISFSEYKLYTESHVPFFKSILFGKLSVCKYLLHNKNYDINIDAEFPFRLAIKHDHINIAEWILPFVKNIHDKINNQDALYYACLLDNIDMIKWLISHTTKYNIRYDSRHIGLIMSSGSLPCIEFILSQNFMNTNLIDEYSRSAILFGRACMNKNVAVPQLMLSKFPDINIHINNEEPLRFACANNKIDTVKWLLTLNVDIHSSQNGAYIEATRYGHVDMFKFLLDIDNSIDIHTSNYLTAAILNNKIEMVKYLLSLSSDIKLFGLFQLTELFKYACRIKNHELFNIVCPIENVSYDAIASLLYSNVNIDAIKYIVNKNICNTEEHMEEILQRTIDCEAFMLTKYFIELWNKCDTSMLHNKHISRLCKAGLLEFVCKYDNNFNIIIKDDNFIHCF